MTVPGRPRRIAGSPQVIRAKDALARAHISEGRDPSRRNSLPPWRYVSAAARRADDYANLALFWTGTPPPFHGE